MNTMTTPQSLQSLCMETAVEAGFKLCRDAIWDHDRVNWIGANVAPSGGRYQVVRSSCAGNLYSGVAGIALFLGRLSAEVQDPVLEETLNASVRSMMELRKNEASQFAWFSGALGIADTLITLGELKNNQTWKEQGWKILSDVCKHSPQEQEIDIISGVAGAIPALLRRYNESGKTWLLDAAVRCGKFLVRIAEKHDHYLTWITMPGSPGLTGYSHGNAGIALALLELYHVTKQEEWLNTAMPGFQYERLHFDAKHQNWPDLRQMNGQKTQGHICAEAWCHGAPGIALPRLRAWEITGDQSFLQEARIALQTTRTSLHRNTANYSLCHGAAGNADVLLTAGLKLNDQVLVQAAQEAARAGTEQYSKNRLPWPAGVSDPNGGQGVFENPSLMLGLAGTGYFYLRMAKPESVPTVLLV